MLQTLASIAPNLDAAKVLVTGAPEIQSVSSGGNLAAVVNAYMVGMKSVFALLLLE